MIELMPFQKEGRDFLRSRRHALLADDMGLGKTVQTLAALKGQPCLVVCPTVAAGVWERECRDFRPDYNVLACDKLTRFPDDGELMVLPVTRMPTHPLVADKRRREEERKARKPSPTTAWDKSTATVEDLMRPKSTVAHWQGVKPRTQLVFDEAHLFKTKSATRTEDARTLSRSVFGVWLLTGTPILSYATDLWEILALAPGLERKAFGNLENFRRLYGAFLVDVPGKHGRDCPGQREVNREWCHGCRKAFKWGHPPEEYAQERYDSFCTVALRRMKREVLPQLPQAFFETIKIPLGLSQADVEEIDASWDALDAKTVEAIEKLMASPSKPEFKQLATMRAMLAESRLNAVVELVEQFEESKEPLIVFSAHRAVIDAIGNRRGWCKIVGGQGKKIKQTWVDAFQAGRRKGIACTIQAAGVGITLTRACNVLFVDRDWTPALNRQAVDRAVRIGQTRGVRVITMQSDHPIDLLVDEVLKRKEVLETSTYALIPAPPKVKRGDDE